MCHYSVFFCSQGLESHTICILLMAEWQNALGAPSSNCLALLRFGFIILNMHLTSCSRKLEVFNKQQEVEVGGGCLAASQIDNRWWVPCSPACMVLDAPAARPLRTTVVPSEFSVYQGTEAVCCCSILPEGAGDMVNKVP